MGILFKSPVNAGDPRDSSLANYFLLYIDHLLMVLTVILISMLILLYFKREKTFDLW